MRWATLANVHFDRVASAWLILRHIDRDAEFLFVDGVDRLAPDVTAFGIPGAALAPHDGAATTFGRILDAHGLDDPVLAEMARLIATAVDEVMGLGRLGEAERDRRAHGLLAIAEGLLLTSGSDAGCIAASLPLYDALHARLAAQPALERHAPRPPSSLLDQTLALSQGAARLRRDATPYSPEALARALDGEPKR